MFPNLERYQAKFITNIYATIQMVLIAGVISFVIGLIVGIILAITSPGGIKQNKIVHFIVSILINVLRAVPFIILLVVLIPFTRKVIGTAIGVKGAIIPLVFGTVPFFSRQVETSLMNVDHGKIEAARSMGSSTIGIIIRVYLYESVPELIRVTTITAISLVGLTAMAGAVGAGGLGDFAISYGQGLNNWDIVWACVIVLMIIISIIQAIGSILAKLSTNRKIINRKIK